MIRSSDRRIAGLVVAALCAALTLAACGRKAGLDAPPSTYLPTGPQTSGQPYPGETPPASSGPNLGSQPSSAQSQIGPTTPPPQKTFLLDWLLN